MTEAISTEFSTKFLAIMRHHLRFLSEDQPLPVDEELRTLGLDSLKAIDLLLELELSFNIVFPDSLLMDDTFRTARNLELAVWKLAAENNRQ
jgi:acyl carrier protein